MKKERIGIILICFVFHRYCDIGMSFCKTKSLKRMLCYFAFGVFFVLFSVPCVISLSIVCNGISWLCLFSAKKGEQSRVLFCIYLYNHRENFDQDRTDKAKSP